MLIIWIQTNSHDVCVLSRRMTCMMMMELDHWLSHCSWPSLTCSSALTSLCTATGEALWALPLSFLHCPDKLIFTNALWETVYTIYVSKVKDVFCTFLLPGLKLSTEPCEWHFIQRKGLIDETLSVLPGRNPFLERNVAHQTVMLYLTVIFLEALTSLVKY